MTSHGDAAPQQHHDHHHHEEEEDIRLLEVTLSPDQARVWAAVLRCLHRIDPVLLLEVARQQQQQPPERSAAALVVRAINQTQSAYVRVDLPRTFFTAFSTAQGARRRRSRDEEEDEDDAALQCAVLIKNCVPPLRSLPSVTDVTLAIAHEGRALQIDVNSDGGALRKHYSIATLDECEILNASLDKSNMPFALRVRPRELSALLSSFPASLMEITIIALLPEKEAEDHLILRSYVSTQATSEQEMYTEVSIDGLNDAIIDYNYSRARDRTEITISLREIRALLSFHEAIGSETELFFAGPGDPLIVEGVGQTPFANGVTTELVLSTLDQAMLMTTAASRSSLQQQQEQQEQEDGGNNTVPGSPPRERSEMQMDRSSAGNEQPQKRARR